MCLLTAGLEQQEASMIDKKVEDKLRGYLRKKPPVTGLQIEYNKLNTKLKEMAIDKHFLSD